jgi:gas vesicle protein
MYSSALDWDGIRMGKTIALKLSKKEEQIITQFNKKGMTNSDLLRSALRHYVQNMPEFSSEDAQMKNIFVKQETIQSDFSDSVKELKSELQVLHEQLQRTQKQVESEMKTLQRQLYLLTAPVSGPEQRCSSVKIDIARDIHQQVDEFLNEQTQKNGIEEVIQ